MKLKLVVLAGAKEGLEIPLKKEKFLIGRAKECALRAGSEAISRQHCAITRHENRYTVKDLGSRNGTNVNDKRITDKRIILVRAAQFAFSASAPARSARGRGGRRGRSGCCHSRRARPS